MLLMVNETVCKSSQQRRSMSQGHYTRFLEFSREKIKAGIFDGPQVRNLIDDTISVTI